jgi:hypothetical protein
VRRRKWFVLVEALGLALLLAAWALDWRNVQSLSGASGRVQDSMNSVQNAFLAVNLRDTVQLEAAVTRACSGHGLVDRPYGNYALAWASPEVRQAWVRRTSSELQNMRNLLLVLQTTQVKYSLPSTAQSAVERVSALAYTFSEIQGALEAQRAEADTPSPSELGEPELREGILAAHGEIVGLMNSVTEDLANAVSRRSFPYQVVFMIGSALVVLARLGDWYSSRDAAGRQASRSDAVSPVKSPSRRES